MKRIKNSLKTKYKAAISLIISLVLYLSSYILDFCLSQNLKSTLLFTIIINLLVTFASIVGVSFLWELISKKSFADEVLQLNGVSKNYIESGIINVYDSFTDIDWNNKLKNAYSVCFFFVYAKGWRSRNRTNLQKLKDSGATIKVILPNLNNTELMDEFDRRFQYGKYAKNEADKDKSTKSNIKDAIQYFSDLGSKIYLFNNSVCSTYYVIDKKIIFSPFNHDEKQSYVPAIECEKDGTFYKFCKKDIEVILELSEVINEQ